MLVGLLSGATCLGIGGRLVMRGLALATGRPTNFGGGATAGIVLIGSVLGLLGGALFAFLGRRFPPSALAQGLIFGTLFFALLIPIQPAAVQEEIDAFRGHLLLATSSFWSIFAAYGVMMSMVTARWDASKTVGALSMDRQ